MEIDLQSNKGVFLFTSINPHQLPSTKLKITDGEGSAERAVYNSSFAGPCFECCYGDYLIESVDRYVLK